MRELFDNDKWVKDAFAAHLGEPLLERCEALPATAPMSNEMVTPTVCSWPALSRECPPARP